MLRPLNRTAGWGETPRRAALLVAVAGLSFAAGVSTLRLPMLVPLSLLAPLALGAALLARRYSLVPLLVVIATSSAAVLLFLPASARDAGQRAGLESYGLVTALATVLALSLFVVSRRDITWIHRGSAPIDRIMIVFVVLALVAGLVGLASGNARTYMLSDVYRIGMLPAVYFITVSSIGHRPQVRTVIVVLAVALTLQHTRDAAYSISELAANETFRVKSVFWIQNLVGLVALVTLAFESTHIRHRLVYLHGALFLFAVGLTRGFRTYLLALAVVLVAPLLMRPSNGPRFLRGGVAFAFVCGPALFGAYVLVPNAGNFLSDLGDSFSSRFELATSGEDASASQRSLELDLVIDRLSSDRFALLAGTGAGSVYQLPYWASAYALEVYADDEGRLHNVHNSYGSMALRSGLPGLAAIIVLFITALWQARKVTQSWTTSLGWFPFLAILGYVLASPFFFFVPGDVIFPVVVGLVGAYHRLHATGQPGETPLDADEAPRTPTSPNEGIAPRGPALRPGAPGRA